MKKQAVFIILTRLMALVMLAACQYTIVTPGSPLPIAIPLPLTKGEVNIPFETLIEDDWGMDNINYIGKEPQLILVTTQNEIDKLAKMVSIDALGQLQQVDFQRYFVIALFRGVKPTSNYQTIIERITQKDDQLIVYAQFWEPNPSIGAAPAHTSPYSLVKITRNGIVPTQIKLVLQSTVQSPLAHPDSGQEEILPFETIELQQPDVQAQSWIDPSPGLLIIARPEDIQNVSSYITDEAKSTLTHLDFTQNFALVAFDGWKSELLYDFHVDRIVRQEKQVAVLAQPSGKTGTTVLSTESSLYHLVKIKKEGNWNQLIMFKLYFQNNQAAIVTVSHYIP